MTIPTKKLRNGFELPVLGFGTWTIGGRLDRDTSRDDQHIREIRNALDAGLTHFDTAEMYSSGHAEELLGEAIKSHNRSSLQITSKVSPSNLAYKQVISACEHSLKRLNTTYVDLYLVHAPNDSVPIAETLKALNELQSKGIVRHIGVSNFTTKRLKEALEHTRYPIVTNQVLYNLLYRQPETDGLIRFCQKNDILVTAFRPVERGMLAQEGVLVLDEISKKYNKTQAQVAINWLTSQDNVIAIAKMSNPDHLKENIEAVSWTMDQADVETLRASYPHQEKRTSDTPLR